MSLFLSIDLFYGLVVIAMSFISLISSEYL